MNWHRMWTVVRREWLELRQNKTLVGTIVGMPAVFVPTAVGTIAWLALALPAEDASDFGALANVPPALLQSPDGRLFAAMLVGEQMLLYMMMMPLLLPQILTATSIVGEKQAKSLEPLLATPIETRELLVAKTLSSVIPATFVTWASYILVIIGVYIASPYVATAVVLRPAWVLGFAVHSPLLGLLSAMLGVMASSRAKDVKSGQSTAGLAVLPIMGFGVWMLTSQQLLTLRIQAIAAAVMVALLYPLLRISVALFQREKILTQWK